MSSNGHRHAVIYVRTASRRQTDATAIKAQLRACRRVVRDLGAVLTFEFIDRGSSGASLDRAGLKGLLAHIEAHQVNYVVCTDGLRLARDYPLLTSLTTRLVSSGVQVILIDGGYPPPRKRPHSSAGIRE
jgi:DNA invertase Pin-like site-specific DNA recombinase